MSTEWDSGNTVWSNHSSCIIVVKIIPISLHQANSEPVALERFSDWLENADIDPHTDEIVASLGGLDQILRQYIRINRQYDDEALLSPIQMSQITKIVDGTDTVDALEMTVDGQQRDTIWDKLFRDSQKVHVHFVGQSL